MINRAGHQILGGLGGLVVGAGAGFGFSVVCAEVCSPAVVPATALAGAITGVAAAGVTFDQNHFESRSEGSGGGDEARPERQPDETANFNYAVKKLGLDKNDASEALHQIKKAAGLRGSDNVWIHTINGNVRAQATGEVIGNLLP
jgi:hypothetical protein